MKFIRIYCSGCLNSFRQPDFHTYHKTLPLPPKTTVAGMIGSALGIPPKEVNEEWLVKKRFRMGVVGKSGGRANDLWQIRKYEGKHIGKYYNGEETTPYKTAVIVRELLYATQFILYLTFDYADDFSLISDKLQDPAWALSLGREDELITIHSLDFIELDPQNTLSYKNTVLPFDLSKMHYNLKLDQVLGNLMEEAPKIVRLPIAFQWDEEGVAREGTDFETFSFVFNLPIQIEEMEGYFDQEMECAFQVF